MLGFYNLLFLSRQDLIDIYKELNSIQKITFLGSVKTPKINFYALLKEYCNIFVEYKSCFVYFEIAAKYYPIFTHIAGKTTPGSAVDALILAGFCMRSPSRPQLYKSLFFGILSCA